MNWFSRLRGGTHQKELPTPEVSATVHEIIPQVTLEDVVPSASIPLPEPELIIRPVNVILKRLKWVDHKGRVGIVYELDNSGFAIIHFTDPLTGETVAVDRVRCGELKLATYRQIPEVRRKNLTAAVAATLGYC